MQQRCQNPNHMKYASYGEKGIRLCDRWSKFENFYEDMGERPAGHTIDRIDPRGNYEPANCRWATPKQQQNNLRMNTMVHYHGEEMTLSELSDKLGVRKSTLDYRIRAGWPEETWANGPWKGARVSRA